MCCPSIIRCRMVRRQDGGNMLQSQDHHEGLRALPLNRVECAFSHIEAGMTTVAHPPKKGYRTIRLPLAESEYDRFLTDRSYAKDRLEELYEECAELFPDAFPSGYAFFGYTESSM